MKHRHHPVDRVVVVTGDHERDPPCVFPDRLRPGDRRVEQDQTEISELAAQLPSAVRVGGTGVDHDRPRPQPRPDRIPAEQRVADDLPVGEHRDHDFGLGQNGRVAVAATTTLRGHESALAL